MLRSSFFYTCNGLGRITNVITYRKPEKAGADTADREDGETVRYEYDGCDQLSAIVYPDGTKVSCTYDNYPDFLECEKSWSTEIVQYRNIDKTYIEFIYDKGKLEEINCRLYLRILTKHNLVRIVEYVQGIEACFLVNDKICLPELEMIISFMKKSKANQYCKSPLEYFKDIDQMG